jgi:fucose permease
MNWLHACWGIGATCGPIVMAYAIGSGAGWRGGYLILGSIQLTLAALFLVTLRLWTAVPERTIPSATAVQGAGGPSANANSPAGWLSAGIFALYVALEMTTGLWAGSILVLSRGFTVETAGFCVAAYYGSITCGRIAVGFVVDHWGNRRLVAIGALLAIAGAASFCFGHATSTAAFSLIALGLGFAPIYPGLMHEVPCRFAPAAVQTVIGRQSGAAALGAASMPATAGWIGEYSLEGIGWVILAGTIGLMFAIRQLDRITPTREIANV